jgi:hypothetical protein
VCILQYVFHQQLQRSEGTATVNKIIPLVSSSLLLWVVVIASEVDMIIECTVGGAVM